MRWVNYHLKNAGRKEEVKNFSSDLKDGENYVYLLNQLDATKCDKSGLDKTGEERAKKIINDAEKLGVAKFLRPKDMISGNSKLNMLFCSELFNTAPGLIPTEEEKYEAAKLLDDDIEGTREERSFRMWINSLGIDGVNVNNLYEDIKDGLIMLKIFDRIHPGCVDWKKVEKDPKHRVKKVHNCNYAV